MLLVGSTGAGKSTLVHFLSGEKMTESVIDGIRHIHSIPPYHCDGLEHFILRGGMSVLKELKGILIEINDDFIEQAEDCNRLLTEAGLVLYEKRHSEMIENNTQGFQHSYNQIWIRKKV